MKPASHFDLTIGSSSRGRNDCVHVDLLSSECGSVQRRTLRGLSILIGMEERHFVKILIDQFGHTPIDEIDQAWADATERQLYPTSAPATRNRQFWTPLISILRRGAEYGYSRPVRLRRPTNPRAPALRWLSPPEAEAVIESSPCHLARLLLFMLCTGARPSEAIYLNWSSLDAVTGKVTLRSYDENVVVTLPGTLLRSLTFGPDSRGAVFRRQDGYPYVAKKNAGGQVKTALRAAAIRAGLGRITLGDIWRTWAVWFLAMYGPDELLRAGRWSSPRSVSRHKAVDKGELQRLRVALQAGSFQVCRMFRETRWSDFDEAEP